MIDALDGDDLFADIMMMRQVDQRLLLILEGPEDIGIIDPHLNDVDCRTELAHGKPNALRIAELLDTHGVTGVFLVLDRDFDKDDELDSKIKSPFWISDHYDLLSDVLFYCPDVLTRVVANHTDRDLLADYLSHWDVTVDESLVSCAAAIGAIRKISMESDLGLNLRRFPVHELVDAHEADRLSLHVVALATSRSPHANASAEELLVQVDALLAGNPDPRKLCNGHDLVAILAALMRDRWGGGLPISGAQTVAKALRSAVACSCFKLLGVYAAVATWAASHSSSAWTCDSR